MQSERWAKVQEVFEAALALTSEAQVSYVETACGQDQTLRQEVLSLLEADRDNNFSFLDQGAPGLSLNPSSIAQPVAEGTRIGIYEIIKQVGEG